MLIIVLYIKVCVALYVFSVNKQVNIIYNSDN